MKKYLFSAAIILAGLTADAQGVGIGTTAPDASSILELSATNKGFLAPRMTTAGRTAITSPATGLQVYDTTTNTFWYYNGTAWTNSSAGGHDNLGNHTATTALLLNDNEIQLRGAADSSQKLVYNATVGGPVLTGFDGGALAATKDGSVKNILTWNNAGSVQVNGAATNTAAFDGGSGTAIDFSKSNLAFTTANATAFTLTGMKSGGTYTLSVRGTSSGTATFDAGLPFTVRYANNRATTANTHTLYTFVVIGTFIYVYTTIGL